MNNWLYLLEQRHEIYGVVTNETIERDSLRRIEDSFVI